MKISASSEVTGDTSANSLIEDFLRAADDYAAMQQEHRAALLEGDWKDLFSWRQRRDLEFRSLVRILGRVIACGPENRECVVSAREITEKLLAEEKVLQELVVARQLKVKEQLLSMRKGKEALGGYNINKGLGSRPRYLSSRM